MVASTWTNKAQVSNCIDVTLTQPPSKLAHMPTTDFAYKYVLLTGLSAGLANGLSSPINRLLSLSSFSLSNFSLKVFLRLRQLRWPSGTGLNVPG